MDANNTSGIFYCGRCGSAGAPIWIGGGGPYCPWCVASLGPTCSGPALPMTSANCEECAALRADLERERMRVVACGVVAMADTPESAKWARELHADYRTASLGDVERRVDECIALRAERDALRAALEALLDHGGHESGCKVFYAPSSNPPNCDCGWYAATRKGYAALAGKEGK